MNMTLTMTGKPSVDKPWLKYYPKELLDNLKVPQCTLTQYLQANMPGLDVPAIHYYGTEITWAEILSTSERIAKSLKALGFGEGDQIPVFLRSVPEFFSMLLAAEKIGASVLIRDNTIEENVDAVAKANASAIFAHDFLTMDDMNAYLQGTHVRKVILLSPCNRCDRKNMPDYIQSALDANYVGESAHGEATMSWNEFLALGDSYTGEVAAPTNIDRPLFRCYTSGSTGPSKQVVHSAHTMVAALTQMNFYGNADFRPTWLVTLLPPALVAVVISMLLLPLASNKLLILDPWMDPADIDLEFMRYKPNVWPMIPMFWEVIMDSKRMPADYDMSHLLSCGLGCEAYNNTQMARSEQFLRDHNCHVPFLTSYGSSEAGSNIAFHVSDYPVRNGNIGCPMPLVTVSIFKPGTTEELSYGMPGEICVQSPCVMLGYDTPEATAKALIKHPDGLVWLHMGDIGMMNEDGVIYTIGRGSCKRYGGGFLDILPMENILADAAIEGITDHFFVNIPDGEHEGYFIPYLYTILKDGYSVEDIRDKVHNVLEDYMIPERIISLPERPFWHFKTNRIGLTNEVLASRVCCG